eukprot:12714509-Alexandrium_andersonii.AAC.1
MRQGGSGRVITLSFGNGIRCALGAQWAACAGGAERSGWGSPVPGLPRLPLASAGSWPRPCRILRGLWRGLWRHHLCGSSGIVDFA